MVVEGLTLEIIVKISTNMKLNLIDSAASDKLIPKNKLMDDEIHFVKFEGFYPTFELSPESIKKGMMNHSFRDWTIVDFDNFLKGNHHTS